MGLTMAEVMVLIVFCLLLLLGGSLAQQEEAEAVTHLIKLRPALMQAAGYAAEEPIPDDFVELIRAGRLLRESVKQLGAPASTTEVEQIVRLGLDARDALGTNTMSQNAAEAAAAFIRRAAESYAEAKRRAPHGSPSIWLESELRAAESCSGRGTVFPSCARTSDGKSALVFTATLSSGAITLHDNRLAELEVARESWPIASIRFDQPLSDSAFMEQTRDLFDWSVARGCRFFVRIADETGASENMNYQVRLRTVEGHFYKHEPFPVRRIGP
jgi:hypothetical protein